MADHAVLTPTRASAWGEPMSPIRKRFSLRSTRGEKGFTLIEVIIAMALLAIVAVAILSGLSTGSRAIFVADERATAESLARSQMEYVKKQPYDRTNNPPIYTLLASPPAGYTISLTAERLDPKGDGTGNDDGIQKITVTVKHHDKPDKPEVITLEGYKVRR